MPRQALDAYLSASWAIDELSSRIPIEGRIFEPCVGAGDLAAPLLKLPGVTYLLDNDIDPDVDAALHLDAERDDLWRIAARKQLDWTITNPPYGRQKPDGKWDKKADPPFEILTRALAVSRVGVALQLRMSWQEAASTKPRGLFLPKHPPDNTIVLPRYSFTGDGNTDSVTTCWFIWWIWNYMNIPPGTMICEPKRPQRRLVERN